MWKVTALSNRNLSSNFEFHFPCYGDVEFKNGVAYVNNESILHYFTRTGRYTVEKVEEV